MTDKTHKIVIEPVTRVEGHGKVTLHLDEDHRLSEARFHITEFRGFEKFVQGRPWHEAPVLVQRLCGICPVSHHLCAAKALDEIAGVPQTDLPVSAEKMRRLMHYGQILQSHALHFFYLSAPDLLLADPRPENRNVVGLAMQNKELAKKGILIRKFGQEIIQAAAGKKIHGTSAVPGGIHKNLSDEDRQRFINGEGSLPPIAEVIDWARMGLELLKDYHKQNASFMDNFAAFESNYISLVREDGALDFYHGRLRGRDQNGRTILDDIDYREYSSYFREEVRSWSYMKFPYLKSLGREKGWYRVGPLARLNNCDFIPSKYAQQQFEVFRSYTGGKPMASSMNYHWARLIEMLHSAEVVQDLLHDPDLQGTNLRKSGQRQYSGVGFLEAPRGTLIHHYNVGANDEITHCNLIVSTTHNNTAMNEAVRLAALDQLDGHRPHEISESMLNMIEVAIRAYDPCLSCATHAVGQMPLVVSLQNAEGKTLAQRIRQP